MNKIFSMKGNTSLCIIYLAALRQHCLCRLPEVSWILACPDILPAAGGHSPLGVSTGPPRLSNIPHIPRANEIAVQIITACPQCRQQVMKTASLLPGIRTGLAQPAICPAREREMTSSVWRPLFQSRRDCHHEDQEFSKF